MSDPLLVPIQLDAFVLNPAVCSKPNDNGARICPITQPNYAFLRFEDFVAESDVQPHADLHNATPASPNSRMTDLGTLPGTHRQNRHGVYVHWTLPRAYRARVSSTDSVSDEQRNEERLRRGLDVQAALNLPSRCERELSPTSFILHSDCHLTGGFGLYCWFDGPHADKSQVGNFVFTIGGYHQAFEVPVGCPHPPPLQISWSYGAAISITGKAHFAITPKACMGSCELHLTFKVGPIGAWFDATADFLMNYRPFYFTADMHVSVGVSYTVDAWVVQSTISAEIGVCLTLWGPLMADRVHVDFTSTLVTARLTQRLLLSWNFTN
ncbi:hypothetical protein SI65_07238 [Aspergillus cristatus]|uniref:DUF6603 domain-containing protein n=1 Tax=Aspergillus cristatus TaxID=573508 RepID=A0A1E3B9B1_ASPCR|nr:hypothetical protein SI65_07238 [Aspergillus cristatus]